MASKQLGKLRQWAGEVISSREKTVVSEEFRELEQDVELRRGGNEKLYFASEAYHHALKKKKDNLALDDPEKLLPIDIMGIVMITHGEEFGDDSTYGSSLVKLGRAHCKIATLQEAYALTFRDTFLASVVKFGDEIKEYDQMKKKLDSRRLSYDAALSKVEKLKNSKKEKDRAEAEEELERAHARYDETTEDMRAQMHLIQEYEIDQMRELTAFLELHLDFVDKYVQVLQEVKREWPSVSSVKPGIRKPTSPPSKKDKPAGVKRSTSVRSSSARSAGQSTAVESSEDDESGALSRPSSRRGSTHQRSDSITSKSRSRPASRATSRSRADSTSNTPEDKSKRMTITGWASAMGSLRGKKKERFANLDDEEQRNGGDHTETEEGDPSSSPSQSQKSFGGKSSSSAKGKTHHKSKSEASVASSALQRMQRSSPSVQDRKVVRALYDYKGSSDELSFKAGDEIAVVNETLEGWWTGNIDGRQGLFPVPYTEPLPPRPPLPVRPDLVGHAYSTDGKSHSSNSFSSSGYQSDGDDYKTSDLEDDTLNHRPLAHHDSPFFGGAAPATDAASFVSDLNDDDDELLQPSLSHATRSPPAPPVRRLSTTDMAGVATPKKAPPPPPPRRSTNNLVAPTPPIPPRRPSAFRSQSSSSSSLPRFIPTPGSSASSHEGYDVSPFESATELSSAAVNGKRNPF